RRCFGVGDDRGGDWGPRWRDARSGWPALDKVAPTWIAKPLPCLAALVPLMSGHYDLKLLRVAVGGQCGFGENGGGDSHPYCDHRDNGSNALCPRSDHGARIDRINTGETA